MKPLCIELFAGLHGWGEGAIEAGYRVIGFDIVDMCARTGRTRHPDIALILQDVLTIHGVQLRDASLILASPPCQEFSYRSQPWKIAKAMKPKVLPEWWKLSEKQMNPVQLSEWRKFKAENPLPPPDLRLFNACWRLQREAIEAAGRYIPMVLENVRGIQPFVGKSRANFGSFHLYGDVGMIGRRIAANIPKFGHTVKPFKESAKLGGGLSWSDFGKPGYKPFGFNTENEKRLSDRSRDDNGIKNPASTRDEKYKFTHPKPDAIKQCSDWFNAESGGISRTTGSKSPKRKQASAEIAKIPFPLAYYIAESFKPVQQ